MSSLKKLTKTRVINKTNITTPLLVPSFSSKGFNNVGQIHEIFSPLLTEASLVSAYDIHYKYIDIDKIYCSDIIFIDSGGYESNHGYDISDVYQDFYSIREWTPRLHEQQISKIKPLTQIVIVNYDYQEETIETQIKKAIDFFDKYKEYSCNFLFKPTKGKFSFDFDEWVKHISKYRHFDIIGFTEKELGVSILERCMNIIRIRCALIEEELDIPIHIFGCLDPLSIIIYFLCGADIFDGLSWLRYNFDNDSGVAIYINNNILCHKCWDMPIDMLKTYTAVNNINVLNKLKKNMITYLESKDIDCFDIHKKYLRKVESLVNKSLSNIFK